MTTPMFEMPDEEPRPPRRRSPEQEEETFVNQFMYLLTAPHIGWPGWEDTLANQRDNITFHRLAHAREIFEEQMCTEFEAMMYVSTVSLAHPINHHWASIYFWLFRRWNPESADSIDIKEVELDPTQVEDLNRLRGWIYRQQINHLKRRHRGAQGKEVTDQEPEPEVQQPQMFDIPEGE